jgi:hypothetical protein
VAQNSSKQFIRLAVALYQVVVAALSVKYKINTNYARAPIGVAKVLDMMLYHAIKIQTQTEHDAVSPHRLHPAER